LCVPTNVNYINVATFVTETEDSSSLIEALQVIKEWNPEILVLYVIISHVY
jgi:RNA binding exosome subunit